MLVKVFCKLWSTIQMLLSPDLTCHWKHFPNCAKGIHVDKSRRLSECMPSLVMSCGYTWPWLPEFSPWLGQLCPLLPVTKTLVLISVGGQGLGWRSGGEFVRDFPASLTTRFQWHDQGFMEIREFQFMESNLKVKWSGEPWDEPEAFAHLGVGAQL